MEVRHRYRVKDQSLLSEEFKMVNHGKIQRVLGEGEVPQGVELLDANGEPFGPPFADDGEGELIVNGTELPVWLLMSMHASGLDADKLSTLYGVAKWRVEAVLKFYVDNPGELESLPKPSL